jgi:hypothetical protein
MTPDHALMISYEKKPTGSYKHMQIVYTVISAASNIFRKGIVATFREAFFEGYFTKNIKTYYYLC